ncbi:MAG: hypothetical protein JWO16_164, partial [Sphingomonas bacterium]|nr:hypothetical protein [Sphingomonas bacterium]
MKTIAAGDEVGIDALLDTVLGIAQPRCVALQTVERHAACFEDDVQPARRRCVDQVADDLGLTIDGDMLARELGDLDPDQALAIGKIEAFFQQPVGVEPRIYAELAQKVGCDRFQNARAITAFDLVSRLALNVDAFDPCGAQEMAEHEARRPAADDR